MKRMLSIISLLVAVFVFAMTSNVSAQAKGDTLFIPGSQSLQTPSVDPGIFEPLPWFPEENRRGNYDHGSHFD